MVSLIKNQLLKHLSRFTKNLSADKINLSTFKGEGELSNLELDEAVLTDLLELPSWLRLTQALCNRVTFRIQWTRLKTVPIYLSLDEVNITVETCEELRSVLSQGGLSSYVAVPGKYSFIHKVIDGMTVAVNTVNITFNSPAFVASVQISRIMVESKSPNWENKDLRMTRLKDSDKGQLLIFKELVWQTVRIEARSTKDSNLTPLRLLTNQARCRITIKKRLSDCFIMGSRLAIILDDLLWVLTDSQLTAALHFLDSLAGLVQKANEVTRKVKAARKLEVLPEYQAQITQQARANKESTSTMSRIFSNFDVIETSYHFVSQQIVLHFCDDPGAGRSCHPDLKEGGALQISLINFQVDYYPYHLAKGDRKHWAKYKESSIPHTQWLEKSLASFRTKFLDLVDKNHLKRAPLSRSSNPQSPITPQSRGSLTNSSDNPFSPKNNTSLKNIVTVQLSKLMTTCIVLRVKDFTLYKVTTCGKKQALKEFITGSKQLSLPESGNVIHAEFTYFYYPGDVAFPLPPPKFYVQMNPIQVTFDVDSCLWLNSFALNLYQSLSAKADIAANSNLTYIDVKVEMILPKVVFENPAEHQSQRDRPKSFYFQVTRAMLTNVRSLEHSSRADLAKCVDAFHMGSLFYGGDGFPSRPHDLHVVTQKLLDHISAGDDVRAVPQEMAGYPQEIVLQLLTQEMLWTEAKDVWCISLDPVWGDFLGARSVGVEKPVPFLDAVPVTVWLHMSATRSRPEQPASASCSSLPNDQPKTADIHALADISNLVSVQINHYQFLFLLRLAEEVTELTTYMAADSNRILSRDSDSIVFGALLPQLEVTFVMPSQCPGQESSGELDSVVPDSSSIAEDGMNAGSGTTLWQAPAPSQFDTVGKKNTTNQMENSHLYDTFTDPLMNNNHKDGPSHNSRIMSQSTNSAITNNFNVGLSSVKKGFSSLMTSIDSALKPGAEDGNDAVSIRSDGSSDSENFIVINLTNPAMQNVDAMFHVPGSRYEDPANSAIEVASEVMEEEENTLTSSSDHSPASSYKRRDLVSVATFKLTKVEFLQQSVNYNSSIKVQVSNVTSDECGSIPWDEFQTKFSTRSRAWVEAPANSSTAARVKLRLDHDLILPPPAVLSKLDLSDKCCMKKFFKDYLDVEVENLKLVLAMSTLSGMADLIEDELILPPLPFQIVLNDIAIRLNEDRPPSNITSPGAVPVDLNIQHLYITRGNDGVFKILPINPKSITDDKKKPANNSNSSSSSSSSEAMKKLEAENDVLKRRLLALERISGENRQLRESKEENDILKSCLSSAQDDIIKLLEDKKQLLETVRSLREQSGVVDRSRQWLSKR